MTPAAWCVIIGSLAASLLLPAWNSYWTSKHDFELKALQLRLESVNSKADAVNDKADANAKKHDALVSAIAETGVGAAMAKAAADSELAEPAKAE
jgi:hypothetical protein